MEPFNIKIEDQDEEITLTILPADEGYYKVIYYVGILGAVRSLGNRWEQVPPEEVIAGELPLYEADKAGERHELVLTDQVISDIGVEIEAYLADHERMEK